MSYNQFSMMMERAKSEVNSEYKKELDKIRNKVYELNKVVGFYDITGMEYEEFLDAMRGYSYHERLKIAYAFYQHIEKLDNIIFDEEGEA